MFIQPLGRVLTIQSLAAIILPFAAVLILGAIWALPQIRKDGGEQQIQLAQGPLQSLAFVTHPQIDPAAANAADNAQQRAAILDQTHQIARGDRALGLRSRQLSLRGSRRAAGPRCGRASRSW